MTICAFGKERGQPTKGAASNRRSHEGPRKGLRRKEFSDSMDWENVQVSTRLKLSDRWGVYGTGFIEIGLETA